MTEILCSVVVPGDPETVYDYVADGDYHSLWQRDLRHREQPMPELVRGSTWRESRRLGSRELTIDVTVTETERPQRIAFEGTSGKYRGRSVLEFYPEGSLTRVVHRTELRARGLSVAFVWLIARHVRSALQANLYRLTMRLAQPTQPTA
ncbi:MAG TPA: SRPBCC family protein [Jatrophihabitantaceae bacterium]|nr:SRPBCC family protein [Jatrophihabitantaceae bacterium]